MSFDNEQFRGAQVTESVRLTKFEREQLSLAVSGRMVSVEFAPEARPVQAVERILAARLLAERERITAAFPCSGHGFSPEGCFHCQAKQKIAALAVDGDAR